MYELLLLVPQQSGDSSFPLGGIIVAGGLAAAGIFLGMKGFSEVGLPLTHSRNITGLTAKITGVFCFGLGLAGIVLLWSMLRRWMMT